MPPARTDVEGVLLPPEPPPELDVGEAAAAVLLVPPEPPAPNPALDEAPEMRGAWLEDCKDAEVDVKATEDDDEVDEVREVGVAVT